MAQGHHRVLEGGRERGGGEVRTHRATGQRLREGAGSQGVWAPLARTGILPRSLRESAGRADCQDSHRELRHRRHVRQRREGTFQGVTRVRASISQTSCSTAQAPAGQELPECSVCLYVPGAACGHLVRESVITQKRVFTLIRFHTDSGGANSTPQQKEALPLATLLLCRH